MSHDQGVTHKRHLLQSFSADFVVISLLLSLHDQQPPFGLPLIWPLPWPLSWLAFLFEDYHWNKAVNKATPLSSPHSRPISLC